MMLWIKIQVTDSYIHLIKLKKYRNTNIANFAYYRITRM